MYIIIVSCTCISYLISDSPFSDCFIILQVERRRSKRTAGQRKRYVDDLNISFSDEEMQEGIMNPASRPLKEYKGQRDGVA